MKPKRASRAEVRAHEGHGHARRLDDFGAGFHQLLTREPGAQAKIRGQQDDGRQRYTDHEFDQRKAAGGGTLGGLRVYAFLPFFFFSLVG